VGIRETLEKKKSLTVVAMVVVIIGSIIAIIVQARGLGPVGPGDAFYTVDDGKTFFVGDAKNLPPFDQGGKQAVTAHVFECGGKRVVGYVSRYTADALATIAEANRPARPAGYRRTSPSLRPWRRPVRSSSGPVTRSGSSRAITTRQTRFASSSALTARCRQRCTRTSNRVVRP